MLRNTGAPSSSNATNYILLAVGIAIFVVTMFVVLYVKPTIITPVYISSTKTKITTYSTSLTTTSVQIERSTLTTISYITYTSFLTRSTAITTTSIETTRSTFSTSVTVTSTLYSFITMVPTTLTVPVTYNCGTDNFTTTVFVTTTLPQIVQQEDGDSCMNIMIPVTTYSLRLKKIQ
ncbi:MAG TPA: hypothetical protein ENF41_02235 [Candidatus Bathyarchaeota archaeon]|nr:hypothetical protein [Candidatus Bathyarchaeota archaeon]